MIINYRFPCGELIKLPDDLGDDGYSDYFDYEFEVEPTEDDIKDFFKVEFKYMADYRALDDTAKLCIEKGAEQQLKRIFDAIPDLTWWKDMIEGDDDFYEFMKERYEDEARKEAYEE